jgi:LysR family transcriptional regulator, hydrogen peroxide-inducible genes activator
MNIRDLKYLLAVADLRNFTAASEMCHVSQPTLSTQIKKLEDTLGVAIFERNNKEVRVTDVGEGIIAAARRALTEVDTMIGLAKQAQDPFSGTLTLGAFPTLAPYYLPEVVTRLRAVFPKLTLQLVEEKTDKLLTMLEEGRLDAALLALPAGDGRLASQFLFSDPFLVAVPEGHKLAEKEALTYDDIRSHSLLLLEDGHCLRDQALEVCTMSGLHEEVGFRATSLETLRQMVKAGTGITLIPKLALREEEGVRYLPFAANPPKRDIGLLWRKTSSKKQLLESLTRVLQGREGNYRVKRKELS